MRPDERVEIDKQLFVEALGQISDLPSLARDDALRDLSSRYKKLGSCADTISFDLRRLGYERPMSFGEFICLLTESAALRNAC